MHKPHSRNIAPPQALPFRHMNTAFLLQEEQGHGEISADAGTFGRQGVANLASLTPGDAERCGPLATSGILGSRDPDSFCCLCSITQSHGCGIDLILEVHSFSAVFSLRLLRSLIRRCSWMLLLHTSATLLHTGEMVDHQSLLGGSLRRAQPLG